MSEATHPDSQRTTSASNSGLFHRLRYTPLRDVVRGRLTSRLDWRGRIAAPGLPAPASGLVTRVVKRTRLWRSERAEVAHELCAHFADGLEAGTSVEELIRDFGDERAAAKLIRRAKRRNRPLAWHALKWTRRALLVLVLLYGLLLVRFLTGQPTLRVDYYAKLNAATLATPTEERAWPIYRQAIISLGLEAGRKPWPLELPASAEEDDDRTYGDRTLLDLKPGDPAWPHLVAWIHGNQDGIATIRRGAAKEQLGFILGRDGDAEDYEVLRSSYVPRDVKGNPLSRDPGWQRQYSLVEKSMIGVLLPYLNPQRMLAQVLVSDARVAMQRRDADRLPSDLVAIRGLAAQLRMGLLINQHVGLGIDGLLLDVCDEVLRDAPDLFDERQLTVLAHRLTEMGGTTAASMISYDAERAGFHDVVQRLYTDDGDGDGRLTRDGALALPMLSSIERQRDGVVAAQVASVVGFGSIGNTRREVVAEYARLIDVMQLQLNRPAREAVESDDATIVSRRLAAIRSSPMQSLRLLPLLIFVPERNRVQFTAERVLGERDGATVGIALELYRCRNNGQYPAALDVLVPGLLPRLPEDRITGEPLRYQLIDSRPVVYSVGVDRDDDGARAAKDAKGQDTPWLAGEWLPRETRSSIDGDWVVFDGRPQPSR